MVLGAIAAIGAGLAGFGIYRGSRDVGRAARNVGRGAEDTLHKISREVAEMRVFLTNTAWPEVNKTIVRFREVLDSADVLLVTSTFTVKVLALFFALCAAFVTHKLIAGRESFLWRRRRSHTMSAAIENTVLQTVYCLCVLMAMILVVQLIKDLFQISWPHSVPFIVVIPSLATLAILYQHLAVTVKTIFSVLQFIPYVIIEFPINMGLDPVTKGSVYMRGILLQLGMCVIYLLLYSFVPYGAYMLFDYLAQSEKSVLKCLLIGYGVFVAATMIINVLSAIILTHIIRPIWAFQARRFYL